MIYAQLENNICVGISDVAREISDVNYIPIPSLDVSFLRRVFENGQWTDQYVDLNLNPSLPPEPDETALPHVAEEE